MLEEKILLNATVCLLVKGDEVLLALKTKKIGAGCWNGYGGGVEVGETIEQCAIRELEEESGLIVKINNLDKVAIVDFYNTKSDGVIFVCTVHFFIAKEWAGELKETDEMIRPTFFNINNLPFDQMMPADREYFPLILRGHKVMVTARYGPYQKELQKDVEIQEVESFR